MSAKITIIIFIVICFEIGILLIVLPWVPFPSWSENHLLVLVADKMHAPWLATAIKSGYARGAVTGLGALNILLGVWEIINFKKTAQAVQQEWESDESTRSLETAHLSDNRSAVVGSAEDTSKPELPH